MIDHRRIGITEDGQPAGGNTVSFIMPNFYAVRAAVLNRFRHGPKDLRFGLVICNDYGAHDYSVEAKAFIAFTAPMRASEVPSSR